MQRYCGIRLMLHYTSAQQHMMTGQDIVQAGGSLLRVAALVSLVKWNKAKKSIYGLSYDLLLLTLLQYLSSFSVFVFHSLAITHHQYANRYPVFPDAPLSVIKFLLDTVGLILSVYLVFQMMVLYKRSQNVEQDLSILAVAVVLVVGLWNLFVLLAGYGFWSEHKVVYKTFEGLPSGMGSFGLFWLDFVWFIELEGKIFGSVKLVPQASLNFSSFSSFGYCLTAATLDTAASALLVISWVLSPSNDIMYPFNQQQIRHKLNHEPTLSAFINLIFGGLIIYQHKIYRNNKPIVKLRYIQTEEYVELQDLRVC